MKILLLGDGSGYHATLAAGLAARGHDVTVASAGSYWMHTARNIDLSRRRGRIGGAILWARLQTVLSASLKGYDIVHFNSPCFVELRPKRLVKLLRTIKRNNGRLYLSAIGTDSLLVKNFLSPQPAIAYSEWHNLQGASQWSCSKEAERDRWLAPELVDYTNEFYASIDGAVSALYEYHRVLQAVRPDLPLAYGGIPIEIPTDVPERKDTHIDILFAAHRGREAEKGADRLLPMLSRLCDECGPNVRLHMPANMPLNDFKKLLERVDIVSDQLYSYTPATTALMAMARGAVPISGGEDEYYRFIGENRLRPIVNADPFDLDKTRSTLAALCTDIERLRAMQHDARIFAARHNDVHLVAERFEQFWLNR